MEADLAMAARSRPVAPRPRGATRDDAVWLRERYRLTAREARVALLIAEGHVAKEVATMLGVTVFTVRAHLRNIFAKIGVGRQAALVRVVLAPTEQPHQRREGEVPRTRLLRNRCGHEHPNS